MIKAPETNNAVDEIVAAVMDEAIRQEVLSEKLYDFAKSLTALAKAHNIPIQPWPEHEPFANEIARTLLLRLAEGGPLDIVLKALAAVGAPASIDLINEGLQAAKEAKRHGV